MKNRDANKISRLFCKGDQLNLYLWPGHLDVSFALLQSARSWRCFCRWIRRLKKVNFSCNADGLIEHPMDWFRERKHYSIAGTVLSARETVQAFETGELVADNIVTLWHFDRENTFAIGRFGTMKGENRGGFFERKLEKLMRNSKCYR